MFHTRIFLDVPIKPSQCFSISIFEAGVKPSSGLMDGCFKGSYETKSMLRYFLCWEAEFKPSRGFINATQIEPHTKPNQCVRIFCLLDAELRPG